MKHATTFTALLFSSVLATPAPLVQLAARDPKKTNNIPDGNKICNDKTYSPNDIKTAVNFGWQAKKDGKQYSKFPWVTAIGSHHPLGWINLYNDSAITPRFPL